LKKYYQIEYQLSLRARPAIYNFEIRKNNHICHFER